LSYAEKTSVTVEKSKAEVERILTRYGASQFVSGWDQGHKQAMVQFDMKNRRIRFVLKMPESEQFRVYQRKNGWGGTNPKERTDKQIEGFVDQEMRRRWRALALVVKAKLEAVESGISEFEEEFLAHIVTGSGQTIGDLVRPKLDGIANSGKLGNLLLPAKGDS
jgi:hypothetical protein